MFNTKSARQNFPLLQSHHPPAYFDSACSALKPNPVIQAVSNYYSNSPACASRSLHRLADHTSHAVDNARHRLASFIGSQPTNLIFTKNTTEGLNLLSHSLPWRRGDVILTTDKEHNSNFLPWLALKPQGVKTVILKTRSGRLHPNDFTAALTKYRPRLAALSLTSNLDGLTIPAGPLIKLAHRHGCLVSLDAAQSLLHQRLNITTLNPDFLAFSSSKLGGPTGLGVLYVKDLLRNPTSLKPFLVGGGTLSSLTSPASRSHSKFASPVFTNKSGFAGFEAGLQNYAGIIGLAAAVDFLDRLDFKALKKHEAQLKNLALSGLQNLPGLHLINPSTPKESAAIISFYVEGHDSHSLAIKLDQKFNLALRSGDFCNSYYFHQHQLPPALRLSLAFYNTSAEVNHFLASLKKIISS